MKTTVFVFGSQYKKNLKMKKEYRAGWIEYGKMELRRPNRVTDVI
jgi:hypothetical protein